MFQPLMIPQGTENKRFDTDFYVEGFATTFDKPYVMYEYGGIKYCEVIDRNALVGADLSDVIMQFDHSGMVELHNHVGQVSAHKGVAVDYLAIFDPAVFVHNIRLIKRCCEAFDVEICIKPLVLRPLWDHQRLEHLTVFPPLHYWHSVQPPFPILILPRIPCEYNTCPRLQRATYSKYP